MESTHDERDTDDDLVVPDFTAMFANGPRTAFMHSTNHLALLKTSSHVKL
jgi:hypothetical protein